MPSVMPFRSPARYAPTPMPIPPKISTNRAMIANPRRIVDLLRLASASTMSPRCEGLMKERRRSLSGRCEPVGGADHFLLDPRLAPRMTLVIHHDELRAR